MRPRSHFPGRLWIGALLIFMLVLPVMQQALAASHPSTECAADQHLQLKGQDNGGDGGKDVPNSGDGDPDDYGRIQSLVTRLILVLSGCWH